MLIRRNRNSRQILIRRIFYVLIPITLASAIVLVPLLMPTKVGQGGVAPLIKGVAPVDSQSANVGLPKRLTIPALNIDAAVAYVGNASDGSMDISPNQDDVAWYKLGPRPGEIGSAVIAGHYGSLRGKFSVFSDLSQLKKGDKLQVQDYKERLVTFVVRESRMYNPTADATDVFNSHDGKIHLNLITCEGAWNNAKESYANRRVVFTDKETP